MAEQQIHKGGKNMENITILPLDIVLIDSTWYNLMHRIIQWRGLDPAIHVLTVINEDGTCLSPGITGIKKENIRDYYKKNISIHRYLGEPTGVYDSLMKYYNTSEGYDFRSCILGGIFGITCAKWVEESNHYTCSELPYWAFQDNVRMTPKDEILPMPRIFRYNPMFDTIYEGINNLF
jgi:hypothetical protein